MRALAIYLASQRPECCGVEFHMLSVGAHPRCRLSHRIQTINMKFAVRHPASQIADSRSCARHPREQRDQEKYVTREQATMRRLVVLSQPAMIRQPKRCTPRRHPDSAAAPQAALTSKRNTEFAPTKPGTTVQFWPTSKTQSPESSEVQS